MPPTFAVGLRACCVAVGLFLATAHAAEQAPSLMGATRDQVLLRYGEPKSQIVAGNRLILFYARERVVLRDGIVIDVERISAEPARRPTETPPAPTSASAEAAPASAPAAGAQKPPAGGSAEVVDANAPPPASPSAPITPAPPSSESKLEIKLVRPPSANYGRPTPAPKPETASTPSPIATATPAAQAGAPKTGAAVSATPPAPTPSNTAPSAAAPAPTTSSSGTVADATTGVTTTPIAASLPGPGTDVSAAPLPATAPAASPSVPPAATTSEAADGTKADDAAAAAAMNDKKARAAKAERRRLDNADVYDPTEGLFTARTYFIAFIVIAGGAGYLMWRRGQRQLALAATAVSHTPFSLQAASASGGEGAMFTPDLLAKLEWKRFEELVAAYYSKTGVVAVRTKTGPASPVHIRISWKGEPRPFACVQCIAHPTGLIDAKPLQDLVAVLAAEDIRRGYVVTSGKFNVNARDLAEEKHITLLPGDIFLDKLNALPDAARAEIMQAITTGDTSTPSCPKCEAKMVRSPDDPSMWRCANHPDQQIPARK